MLQYDDDDDDDDHDDDDDGDDDSVSQLHIKALSNSRRIVFNHHQHTHIPSLSSSHSSSFPTL